MLNTIINGDCREIFPEIKKKYSNIFVITDPPYNIEFKGYEDYKKDGYEDNLSPEDYVKLISTFKDCLIAIIQYPEEMMGLIVPALGVPDEVLAWCYPSNIGRKFRLVNIYGRQPNFNKVLQSYKNKTDKRIKERMRQGYLGTALYDWFDDINIVKNVSKEKTVHPCPVPVALMERLIILLTEEDDIIVDPFMGSGTTGVACVKTKRNYIGIELSEKYCEEAKKRIEGCEANHKGGIFD